jgi:hypothetical protein
MIRVPDKMTVAEWRDLEQENPQWPQVAHRATCRNYGDFVLTLYVELDTIVAALQNDANLLQDYSENALNADICRQLNRAGYAAQHDKNVRGHTDISVEFGRFLWIGEGKKVDSVNNTHLRNGYEQLLQRYMPGTVGADQAGLLIYCYAPSSQHVVAKWKEHLEERNVAQAGYAENLNPVAGNEPYAFWSDSKHVSSGSNVRIKHLAFSLHWAPIK